MWAKPTPHVCAGAVPGGVGALGRFLPIPVHDETDKTSVCAIPRLGKCEWPPLDDYRCNHAIDLTTNCPSSQMRLPPSRLESYRAQLALIENAAGRNFRLIKYLPGGVE